MKGMALLGLSSLPHWHRPITPLDPLDTPPGPDFAPTVSLSMPMAAPDIVGTLVPLIQPEPSVPEPSDATRHTLHIYDMGRGGLSSMRPKGLGWAVWSTTATAITSEAAFAKKRMSIFFF